MGFWSKSCTNAKIRSKEEIKVEAPKVVMILSFPPEHFLKVSWNVCGIEMLLLRSSEQHNFVPLLLKGIDFSGTPPPPPPPPLQPGGRSCCWSCHSCLTKQLVACMEEMPRCNQLDSDDGRTQPHHSDL